MLEKLFVLTIGFFLINYMLRAILFVGYDNFKYSGKMDVAGKLIPDLFKCIFSLKPILQRRLQAKGYDYKVYKRFNIKSEVYYFLLWVSMFLILFLFARLYLGLFTN